MDEVILLNNRFQCPEIQVSVFSPHFNYGMGFFETILYEKGRIFFLQEHLERIRKTCRFHKLSVDLSWVKETRLLELITRNQLEKTTARLKIIYAPLQQPDLWDLCLYAKDYIRDDSLRRVCVHPEIRDSHFYSYKSMNYQANLFFKNNYQAYGDEVLFINSNQNVLEGSISNVLYIKQNRIYFSGNHHSYLKGIMQAKILEVAVQKGLNPVACDKGLEVDELITADEVILTNSLMIAQACSLLYDMIGSKHKLKTSGWAETFRELILNSPDKA